MEKQAKHLVPGDVIMIPGVPLPMGVGVVTQELDAQGWIEVVNHRGVQVVWGRFEPTEKVVTKTNTTDKD